MSANLKLVRSLFEAWGRGEWWGPSDWASPDIEFVLADGPDRARFEGIESMVAGWREFLTAWEGYSVQAEEYRELDRERILVLLRPAGRGRTSGVRLEEQRSSTGANVFQIRAGKVTRLAVYFDHRHALEELGIERSGGSFSPGATQELDVLSDIPWASRSTSASADT